MKHDNFRITITISKEAFKSQEAFAKAVENIRIQFETEIARKLLEIMLREDNENNG